VRATRKSKAYFSPEETYAWLEKQMAKQGFLSLEDLSQACGIDRGTLSRYFRQERRPSVDVIAPLCDALAVSPETLLVALGAIDR
jgi:transcriptional regulator with XRE-family HTH domain